MFVEVLLLYYELHYEVHTQISTALYEHVINDKRDRKILILALSACATIKNHS
jgi:hypothetical protein